MDVGKTVKVTRAIAAAVVIGYLTLPLLNVGAIDPQDHLRHGQDLVDAATREIDERIATLQAGPHDTPRIYAGVHEMLMWVVAFNEETVAQRYRLDEPIGLLVTDGIADTLATRLHGLLAQYVRQNPEEKLTAGRQALELAYARIPMAPGRFLGFHFQHMATLYAMQADTILSAPELRDPDAVRGGFLRYVWDLTQLYEQMHDGTVAKYQCRLKQEDWIVQRARCGECDHRGLKYRNQMTGLREDTTKVGCKEILYSTDTSPEGIRKRFACRSWGHVFEIECPECGDITRFSVPLPYFKMLQLGRALGEIPDSEVEKLMPEQP
jgi:hypothetical protein